jgi:hypothetical protein
MCVCVFPVPRTDTIQTAHEKQQHTKEPGNDEPKCNTGFSIFGNVFHLCLLGFLLVGSDHVTKTRQRHQQASKTRTRQNKNTGQHNAIQHNSRHHKTTQHNPRLKKQGQGQGQSEEKGQEKGQEKGLEARPGKARQGKARQDKFKIRQSKISSHRNVSYIYPGASLSLRTMYKRIVGTSTSG